MATTSCRKGEFGNINGKSALGHRGNHGGPPRAVLFRSRTFHHRGSFRGCMRGLIGGCGSRVFAWLDGDFVVPAIGTKNRKRPSRVERREQQMIAENQYQEQQLALLKESKTVRRAQAVLAGRRLLSQVNASDHSGDGSEMVHPQGVGRLYLAIVNRAVLDVLENGKNSATAEQWLLSRDFDKLQELFG
jgi:hypothetical protein